MIISHRNHIGMTALTKSIVKGYCNIVKIFLSNGPYLGVEEVFLLFFVVVKHPLLFELFSLTYNNLQIKTTFF